MSAHRPVVLAQAVVVVVLSGGLLAPAATRAAPADPIDPTGPSSQAASSADETRYLNTVRDALQRAARRPTGREASLAQPAGSTEVAFVVDRRGRVRSAEVARSSHSTLLDAMATTLVRRESFAPFPSAAYAGEAAHRFVVTYDFEPDRGHVVPGRLTEVAVR